MNILLVLSAKLVEAELQNILGKIPPVMIPVERKLVVDHIISKSGDKFSKIVFVTHESKNLVKQHIQEKKYDVNICELDAINDIGYSIDYALKWLNNLKKIDKLTILFADTFIEEIVQYEDDIVLFSLTEESVRWTTFENSEDLVIFDKKERNINGCYKSFIGYFNFTNVECFKYNLENSLMETELPMDSFYRALQYYSKTNDVKFVKYNNWLDLGHSDTYFNTKKDVESRCFNSIEIDKERGILKKTSIEKVKFINEISWYLKLPNSLKYLTPQVFNYSISYENPYIEMEYYSYNTLHDMFVFGDFSIDKWRIIFKRLFSVLDDFSSYVLNKPEKDLKVALKSIYVDKTISRLNQLKKTDKFKSFFNDSIKINGKIFNNLEYYLENIENIITNSNLLDVDSFSIIHGDFFLANILYDTRNNIVKLIDPRGDFGSCGMYGDRRYEAAKLLHSVDGKYDFIVNDLYDLEISNNKIEYKISSNSKHSIIKNILTDMLSEKYKLRDIKLIESLLFLSMVPLHSDNYKRQVIMLCTGLTILEDTISKYKGSFCDS